jgi:tocopherol O-methyltransferase
MRTDQSIFDNRDVITADIANFWNRTTKAWHKIWGPHIHHGFYEEGKALTPLMAQENLLLKITELLNIRPESRILDVGSGMGGSSLFLAKNYRAHVTGITLSRKQIEIAELEAKKQNIANVNFKIDDALTLHHFSNQTFDMVWSLESCEQFYDKALFLKQAFRVLKPGGKLMLATWCSDREMYIGKMAKQYKKLCTIFDLPYMPSMEFYQKILTQQHFKIECVLDWSSSVKKTWEEGISLLRAYHFLQVWKMFGLHGFRALQKVKMMRDAFFEGRIKYGVFVASV